MPNRIYKLFGYRGGSITVERLFHSYEYAIQYAKELENQQFKITLEMAPHGSFFEYGESLLEKIKSQDDTSFI